MGTSGIYVTQLVNQYELHSCDASRITPSLLLSSLFLSSLLCRFDADLNAAKEEATNERLEKEKLAKDKDTLYSEYSELQTKMKVSNVYCVYMFIA